jgi:hypothetical protein
MNIIILIIFIGILLVSIEIVKVQSNYYHKEPKIIYKYIPRTFEEEQNDPVSVSDIFYTMFSQPSPWINSVRIYDREKQEKINKYFVTQL